MTITPTAVAPAVVPAGAADAGTAAGTAVPGDFLALVQQALADALGGAPDSAVGQAGGNAAATGTSLPGTSLPGKAATPGSAAAPDGATPTDPAGADPALAAAAAGLTALVAPVVPVPTPAVTGGGAATAAVEATTAASSSPAQALPAPDTAKGGTGKAASTEKQSGAGHGASLDATTPGLPAGPDATGDSSQASGQASGQPSGQASGQPSGQHADPGTSHQADVTVPSSVVPAASAAPAAPAPGPATTVSASAPVSGQVFPEVTSLVSRGNGTHRITLTLKPEALGEVRVVMTVRDGAVHVRLAAGHEAQQALLEGSPELSRLLERAGATETRIAVRDLSGATAPTTGSGSGTGTGPDLGQGQGLGAGSNRSQDQHAGTRAEHEATEGRQHTTTTGATEPRGVQTVTRTLTGVDVTM